jgi:hypothetical protein
MEDQTAAGRERATEDGLAPAPALAAESEVAAEVAAEVASGVGPEPVAEAAGVAEVAAAAAAAAEDPGMGCSQLANIHGAVAGTEGSGFERVERVPEPGLGTAQVCQSYGALEFLHTPGKMDLAAAGRTAVRKLAAAAAAAVPEAAGPEDPVVLEGNRRIQAVHQELLEDSRMVGVHLVVVHMSMLAEKVADYLASL